MELTGRQVSIAAVLASFAYSALHIVLDPLLNPDAVTYLLAAQAWLDAGYRAAAAMYPLPYYSILVGVVHTLTGLPLPTSAHALDAVLIAMLIVALQYLGRALGGSVRVELIIVVFMLLLPELNGYRSFVLRDFGYWAFLVIALTCLVRYMQTPHFGRLAAFLLCCLVAAMFRAEAIPVLVLMPMTLLFGPRRNYRVVAALYAIGIGSSALLAMVWSGLQAGEDWMPATLHAGRGLLSDLPQHLQSQLSGFANTVLDPRFHDYAGFGLAGGLVSMIVIHVAIAASLPFSAIAAIGIARGAFGTLDRRALPVLWMAFAITLLGLAAVLVSRGIIQTRYAMPAGMLITVAAAFVVDAWYPRSHTPQSRARMRQACALVLVYFVGEAGFDLFNSKQHYLAGADWLAHHTAPDARIFSNDLRVVFLADRPVRWQDPHVLRESPLPTDGYDYWAVVIGRNDAGLRDSVAKGAHWRTLVQFANRKGDAVVIFTATPR